MKTLKQALLDKILYIGDEIPKSLMIDKRPKFILLGNPQQLIDEVMESIYIYQHKYNKTTKRMEKSKHRYHRRIGKIFENCNYCPREDITE